MKKVIISILSFVLFTGITFAQQRFAYVDTKYVLSKIPAYNSAEKKLNQLSENWQKEVEKKYDEIEKLKSEYESEKILLSEQMRKNRLEEIEIKRDEYKALKEKYFGKKGLLYKRQKELITPIQDDIANAVKEIAKEKNIGLIINVANNETILYSNPKYDKSKDVLKKLGVK